MPLIHRGFGILLFLLPLIASFFSKWVKKRLRKIIELNVYIAIIHLAYVAFLNSYSYEISISLVVTIALANLFFKGTRNILIYNIIAFAAVLLTIIFVDASIYIKLVYLFAYFSTAAFTYFISYQKLKAEKKLNVIAEEQDILVNNIDIQIWYLKQPDKYGKVNQAYADFLGFKRTEIENSKLEKILPHKIATICRKNNEKVFKKKKKLKTEEWIKNSEGESRLLSIKKTPKLDENGEIEYVVCAAEDITEQKEKAKILNNILENVSSCSLNQQNLSD